MLQRSKKPKPFREGCGGCSTASAPPRFRGGSRPRERLEVVVEALLNRQQTADLTSLLAAVSVQARLGSGYRDEADYWAGQVGSSLDADDLQSIASLLEDVAGSPWLPDPIQQWARAWATTIKELTGHQEAY